MSPGGKNSFIYDDFGLSVPAKFRCKAQRVADGFSDAKWRSAAAGIQAGAQWVRLPVPMGVVTFFRKEPAIVGEAHFTQDADKLTELAIISPSRLLKFYSNGTIRR